MSSQDTICFIKPSSKQDYLKVNFLFHSFMGFHCNWREFQILLWIYSAIKKVSLESKFIRLKPRRFKLVKGGKANHTFLLMTTNDVISNQCFVRPHLFLSDIVYIFCIEPCPVVYRHKPVHGNFYFKIHQENAFYTKSPHILTNMMLSKFENSVIRHQKYIWKLRNIAWTKKKGGVEEKWR